jgi:protein-tyrosine-phosphatase
MVPDSEAVLEEVGVYPDAHRARQVNETMLEEADLVPLAKKEGGMVAMLLTPSRLVF